jgi:hypothetical protein
MRRWALLPILAAVLSVHSLPASLVRGRVTDASTAEPLVAANVRLQGTGRGTITNPDGEFSLSIGEGRGRLIVSMLGYAPDTVDVDAGAPAYLRISLRPADILLPEVVVTAEDPGVGIIRRAIAAKRTWAARVRSYEMKAFNRQTIRRDTAVASITESYTTGYWQAGDTLREVVTGKRQTANVAAGMNFASVGRILNFSDDEISFAGFRFVGPIAENALDYYDYRLIRTRASRGGDVYEIEMRPRSRTSPLFTGRLMVSGGSYALAGVDVVPNEAFRIPFVSELSLRYRQQFALVDTAFWMPVDIRIDGAFTVGFAGITIPRLGLHQTSVISDYAMNVALPDSIFRKPRLSVDSSAVRIDSSAWDTAVPLPLSADEQRAYGELDSTQKLEVQFRPRGLLITLGDTTSRAVGILSYLDPGYNRVEGFHLGLQHGFELFGKLARIDVGWAYLTGLKRGAPSAGVMVYPAGSRLVGFGGSAYQRVDHLPDQGYYSPLTIGVSALLWKVDYRDYFLAEGGRLTLSAEPFGWLKGQASYLIEQHEPLRQTTDYSFFRRSVSFRPNPPAVAGRFRSILAELVVGGEPVPLDLILVPSVTFTVEHSSPRVTGGDFSFTRYQAVGSAAIPTFGQSFLLRPEFRIRAAAGFSAGSLPLQRAFTLESAMDGFAPFGAMCALGEAKTYGRGCASLFIEHNFRTLPFLALGIPFLYDRGIELIVHGGAARTWGNAGEPGPVMGHIYTEAGVGLSRILDLFRVDLSWQLSGGSGFAVTVGVAPLF